MTLVKNSSLHFIWTMKQLLLIAGYRKISRASTGFEPMISAMRLQCWCNADAMMVQCGCNAGAMLMQCWCNADAMLVQCGCNAAAMLLQCSTNWAMKPLSWKQGPVSRKSRKLLGSEKPFVKLPTACFGKPIFYHVFKVTKRNVTVKFYDLNPFRSWDTKRIVTPEDGP